jgi:glycosyltransferase involved in cell wall biosynthesis
MNIDIIIPVYNQQPDLLKRCLASIVSQDILDDLYITIVDDASTNIAFYDIIDQFKPLMNLSVIRNPINGGCGVARQFGIDNTSNPYIFFIDSDDTIANSLSLHILRSVITAEDNIVLASGTFSEIQEGDAPFPLFIDEDKNTMTWMHGKLYQRKFIQDNNIRFHPTLRANEDKCFNLMTELTAPEASILTTDYPIYLWHCNNNSIVRRDNSIYSYGSDTDHGYCGYITAVSYALDFAPNSSFALPNINGTMGYLYEWFLRMNKIAPQYVEQNLIYASEFYHKHFKQYKDIFEPTPAMFNEINKAIEFGLYKFPIISYDQFLDLLDIIYNNNTIDAD